MKLIIPYIWNEKQTAIYCLIGTTMQYLAYGLSTTLTSFYIVMIVFSFTSMHGPALLSVIVSKSHYDHQGSIQGSLNR